MTATIDWRTGVNLREFVYYAPEFLPFTQPALQRAQLTDLADLGVQVARVFGCCRKCDAQMSIFRLKVALDMFDEFGMQAIVCLNDSLDSLWGIPGEEQFHSGTIGHLHKDYWLNCRYQDFYLPHIQKIVMAFKDHPAVLMWELGNEFAVHPQPATREDSQAFFAFVKQASAAIKAIAPNTLVSTGLVNSNHVSPAGEREFFARQLYELSTLDAISIHYYQDDGEKEFAPFDAKLASDLGKPFYIGEMGAPVGGDRTAFYDAEIDDWFKAGAFTVMPWAFDTSPQDVGVSDLKAFARIHADFEGLRGVIKRFAAAAKPFHAPLEGLSFEIERITVEPQTATATRFRVIDGPLGIRAAPSLSAERFGQLANDTEIDVEPDSRTEADGYVWWRHRGVDRWTAEKQIAPEEIYMVQITPKPDPGGKAPIKRTGEMKKVTGEVRKSTGESERIDIGGSAIAAPAIRSLPNYLDGVDVNTLPLRDSLFETLPIPLDIIEWVQHFGNTRFAFDNGASMYAFAQGLHSGIDFGNDKAIPVFAGVHGKLTKPGGAYAPRRADVAVGNYLIIYGHLDKNVAPEVPVGAEVKPDTIVGVIATSGISFGPHLHLEIRYPAPTFHLILNPWMFMSEALSAPLLKRNASFYNSREWSKWQSPLDQPVIQMTKPRLVPR